MNQLYTYSRILLLGLLLWTSEMYSQTVDISWLGPPPAALNACSDKPTIHVEITNPTSLLNWYVTFELSPSLALTNNITSGCNAGTIVDNGNNTYTVPITTSNNTCAFDIDMLVLCQSNQSNSSDSEFIQSELFNNLNSSMDSDVIANITVYDASTSISVNNAATINSYIGAFENKEYTLLATGTSIDHLHLYWELESEVEILPGDVEIEYPIGSTPISYTPVSNELWIDVLNDFGTTFSNNSEMLVRVDYHIINCSNANQAIPNTTFFSELDCYGNNHSLTCNVSSMTTNFNVQPTGGPGTQIHWRPANTETTSADFLTNVGITPCDQLDFTFSIHGAPSSPGFPSESATYYMDRYIIHIDPSTVILGNTVIINGITYIINDANNNIVTANQLDPVGITIDFTHLSYPTDWPLEEGNNGFFNELEAGEVITITFEDCTINCAALHDCTGLSTILPGENGVLWYWNMCVGALIPQNLWTPLDNTYNSNALIAPTTIESDETDLDFAGDNVGVIEYFYNSFHTSAWNYDYIYDSPNDGTVFSCPDILNYIYIELDPWLSLVPGSLYIAGNNIPFTYTPVQGGTIEQIFIPVGATLPDGLITIEVINDACVEGSFGEQNFSIEIQSFCNSPGCTDSCPITSGCQSYTFYIHCHGDCTPGFPASTMMNDGIQPEGFSLRRSSFGETISGIDIVDGDFANANANGFILNRAYQCDKITINANGSTSSGFAYRDLTDLYFEMALEIDPFAAVDFDNFEFTNFTGEFSLVLSSPCSNPITLTNIPIDQSNITFEQDPDYDYIRFHIPQFPGYDALLDCDYAISFEGVFEIASDQTTPVDDGNFLLNQIRGQFGTLTEAFPDDLREGSCDSWGAGIRILGIEATITQPGWDHIGNEFIDNDWGADCNACTQKVIITSNITGGMPNADDFPNEIRQVLEWPDLITIDNMTGLEFLHAYYWVQENETYLTGFPGGNRENPTRYIPVLADTSVPGIVELLGINPIATSNSPCEINSLGGPMPEDPNIGFYNNWTTMDKDEHNFQMLIMVFHSDCGISTECVNNNPPAPDFAHFTAEFKSLPETCSETIAIDNQPNVIGPYCFGDNYMTLNAPGGVWSFDAYQNPVEIDLTLNYNHFDAPSLPNPFIYIPGNNVSALTITQSNGNQCGFVPTFIGNGIWQLGGMCSSDYFSGPGSHYDLSIEINYDCLPNDQNPNPITIPIYFGFDCTDILTDGTALTDNYSLNDPCFFRFRTITINPQPSGLSAAIGTAPSNVDPCTPFIVEYILSSTEEADITNLIAELETDGLVILSAEYSYNSNSPIGLAGPYNVPYQIDFGNLIGPILGNHGNQGSGDVIHLFVEYIASCDDVNTFIPSLSLSGQSACQTTIFASVSHMIDINLPTPLSLIATYESTIGCDPSPFTITISNVPNGASSFDLYLAIPEDFVLSGSIPSYSSLTTVMGVSNYLWSIPSPGNSFNITFDITVPTGFCGNFDLNLTGNAIDNFICNDLCFAFNNYSINACCPNCETSADFGWTCIENLCYELNDFTPEGDLCNNETWTISGQDYASVDGFSFCFPSAGSYLICHQECCGFLPNGQPLMVDQCYQIEISNCSLEGNQSCHYIPSAALYDYGSETILGPDGKLATIGELESPLNPGDIDIYLVGHNQSMDLEFNAMFGDTPEDEFTEHNTSICTDGEYYYNLGFIEDGSGTAIFVTKTQLDGTPVWNGGNPVGIAYGLKDSYFDIGYKIIYMTGRQNLLIVGRTNRISTSGFDVFALQLDKTNGSVVPGGYQIYYANTPELLSNEYGYDVKEVVSDKLYYAIAGETRLTSGERNGLGLLIDDNLSLLADFATTGMNDQEEVFYGVEQFDNYLYFSGMYSRIGFDKEGLIMQVPLDVANFNVVEAHHYDGAMLSATPRDDYFGDIVRDGDHMVISARTNDTDPLGTKDAAAIFVSNNLNAPYPITPVRTNKELMPDAFFDVCVLPDQLVFTGTISPTGTNDEIFIVNTDKYGLNDCCTKPYDFKHHLLDKESHRTLDQKSVNIAKEPWGLYDNYSNTIDLCDTVDTCYHPCLVVANWNFQHVNGCTYQLGDASSFLPGTIITSYEWSIDGGAPFAFGVSTSVTLTPGPHTICLLVRGINEQGEKCEDKFCQVLTCCEQQHEECGGNALFTATPLPNPCVYQFTDLSTAFVGSIITGWNWNFGDGSTSTTQNPIHAYGDTGPYTVTLTVEYLQGDIKCDATFELIIYPHCSPNCDISISDLGLHPDACMLATSPIVNYAGPCTIHYYWEFGDGTVSNLPNPVHTYQESGVYEICLTVWVECNGYMCSARSCKSGVAINCPCQCSGVPQFTIQQTADCEVTLTYLNNLNPCLDILDIKWVLGNGQSISGNTAVYQYPAAGSYQICLIITASNGLSVCNLTQCQPFSVNCSNGFAASMTEGSTSLLPCCEPTDFTISNDGCSICVNPIGGHCSPFNDYFFSWGDGTPNSDGPCHTYASGGTYTVILWDNCSYSIPQPIAQHVVTVNCPCDNACFVRARWTFEELEKCTFALTDQSISDGYSTISTWEWFLNGNPFSNDPNATVTITGTQAVCLHITGYNEDHETCESWYCQNLTCCEDTNPCLIHSADFSWQTGLSCLSGAFATTINPMIDETLLCGQWTIDGTTIIPFSTLQQAYTFATAGVHRVCLDIWCCDNPENVTHICKDISIVCPCDLDSMSFTWTANEEDCSSGVFNVTVNPIADPANFCGNWTINGITVPFSGFDLPYDFLPGGPWVVCLDLRCCNDPTGQTFVTYCDTIVTCPCCAPLGFDYELCTGACDIALAPVWPSACANPGTIVYDYGDGSGLTGDACHDYVDNGSYVVCMYMICHVMMPQLIECDTVDIGCDDSFCKTLKNPADPNRPRNDRGSSIASTPDGGFILVGTVNEQYGFCTPSSLYNTLACATDESDIYIAKYSATMALEFDMTLGESALTPTTFYHETGSGVLVRDDGYYILGDVLINDYGQANILDNDIVVAKINLNGTLDWKKRLGTKTADNAKSREYSAAIVDMKIPGDDAILITGTSNRFATVGSPTNNGSNYDFLAVKMDPATGNVLQRKGYWYGNSNLSSNNLVERARDAVRIETSTNPIYGIAGEVFYSSNNERRVFAITIDQNLNLLNNFVLNNPGTFERAWTIESSNGNIYIGGGIGITANTDLFILKLNQNLTLTGQKRLSLGSESHEFLREIKEMSDGKLVGIFQNGSVALPGGFEGNGYLFTIDPVTLDVSDIMSTATQGYDERFVALSDNYYVTGYWDYNAYSTDIYDQDRELYLSKFNATDNSSCCVNPITLSQSTLSGATSGAGERDLNFLTLDHGLVADSYEFNEICPMVLRSALADEPISPLPIQRGIVLMPNPNQGLFTLSASDSGLIMETNIIDVSGKIVYSYKCKECNTTLTLSLNDLSQGVYFVQTTTSTGKWINKLVIQN